MLFSERLLTNIKFANSLAVLTGAGISAESRVPTFRGENGLWKRYRPEDLATAEAFLSNPQLVWDWYRYRRNIISQVTPNPGHYALVDLETHIKDFTLITQNVDNLHRIAGSETIEELHGNIMRNRCVDCNRRYNDNELPHMDVPKCSCGGMIRPDVVLFGDLLPADVLARSIAASRRCDVFISIGTSALVHPAASLPIEAKNCGAYVVEINFEKTVISDRVDESIIGQSGEILPLLINELGFQ
ncbi:NAD-dependent deacylase [candidate division KSB1 bacterium]|nr:NAD-dependent deacylase [candidate division KSB1 bacterium]